MTLEDANQNMKILRGWHDLKLSRRRSQIHNERPTARRVSPGASLALESHGLLS